MLVKQLCRLKRREHRAPSLAKPGEPQGINRNLPSGNAYGYTNPSQQTFAALSEMEGPYQKPKYRTLPRNIGLLQLIRGKREWHWKPTHEQVQKGFRGWHQRGYLPHFDAPDVVQMVTFMLNDCFPITRRQDWEPILQEADNSLKRRKLEAWLDRGCGQCWLARAQIASIVQELLLEENTKRFQLEAWVIMANHVHAVVRVWDVPLTQIISRWKGKSARMANQALNRSGKFWQEDYFDTLIRDEAHLRKAVHYTEANPVKSALVRDSRLWRWGSAGYRDELGRLPWQPISDDTAGQKENI